MNGFAFQVVCQLLFTPISVFCLLSEEGSILEPSKILNEEFCRWTITNSCYESADGPKFIQPVNLLLFIIS